MCKLSFKRFQMHVNNNKTVSDVSGNVTENGKGWFGGFIFRKKKKRKAFHDVAKGNILYLYYTGNQTFQICFCVQFQKVSIQHCP